MSSKESWSSRVRHDSDATFQEWRDELITKINLLTLMVADETNITPAAGARPGANTEQGYAVYHLNDSLHGTAPIYIRFGFGTGSGTTAPRIQVTTGTSTNGSGVLGGTALSTITGISTPDAQTTDTARNSYASCVEGFFGLSWKQGAANTSEGSFFFMRTVDSAGAATATGALGRWGNGNSGLTKQQSFRYAATAAAYTAQTGASQGMFGFFPAAQTSTAVGADLQAAVGYTWTPRAEPVVGVMGVLDSEVPAGSTFTCTPVGTTPRTYIALTAAAGPFGPTSPGASAPKIAMLWE